MGPKNQLLFVSHPPQKLTRWGATLSSAYFTCFLTSLLQMAAASASASVSASDSGVGKEILFVPAVVDICYEAGGFNKMVFAQYTGNEAAFLKLHNLWKVAHKKSGLGGNGFLTFGGPLETLVLPESLDRGSLLTEEQVNTLSKIYSFGGVGETDQLIYRHSILRGKLTLDARLLTRLAKNKYDAETDGTLYENMCGKWSGPVTHVGLNAVDEDAE